MISSTSLVIIIVSFLWSTSALHERYVKPDNPSSQSCPGQPCLTLDQYTQQTATCFTTGSTFLFLPGNHTLHTTVNLTNISDLKFKRSAEQDSTIHGNGGKILCIGVINLTMEGLILKATYLDVLESKDILISNSIFLGNGTLTEHSTSALTCSNSNITIINCHFENNTGNYGGAISIEFTNFFLINSTFIRNMAHYDGGAIYALFSTMTVMYDCIDSVIFSGNSAFRGGAIYLSGTTAVFSELVVFFQNNSAKFGGGIYSLKSYLTLQTSTTLFIGNFANNYSGGAICIVYGTLQILSKNTIFTNNSAKYSGGALYGLSTTTHLDGNIIFSHNSAKRGGGMYFVDVSLKIASGMKLNASFNNASTYGGAIYYDDTLNLYQCTAFSRYYVDRLPHCFIQWNGTGGTSMSIHSYHNSAGKDGSFLYGGSLDRCQLESTSIVRNPTDYKINYWLELIQYQQDNNVHIRKIASRPYQLCSCGYNAKKCGRPFKKIITIETHRGQKFTLSLYAVAQEEVNVSTTVTARPGNTSRLELYQIYQNLPKYCSNISYTLYSTEDHEELTLHPDGSCSEYGKITVDVTFKSCPPGFDQQNDKCVCEKRLAQYTTNCSIIDEDILITRNSDSTFWMDAYFENETYIGLILYNTCPVEYCKTETTIIYSISLYNRDIQCAPNHIGVLCGACNNTTSLILGSSKCRVCSNTYLALLLPFAAAGIALVVFLSILRLTVASGTINSVIIYANIIQVNRHLFFPINTVNVLTVFIAWMNLDLGFETCFYNGMTAFAQTWLQFVFPIYIWILIILITITSKYSVRVSKLIGHNPIAVLATLLLMSYTKILKIIIDVYSTAQLEYPDNKTVTVWLKDGNVPYLQSRHLLLTVVTSLVLVFLFLPYTLLLLLGYKLYRFSGRKHMRWLNRLKPLLDSYYAPYNKHTRCWTGFLLLVRCALYIVFTLGDASRNLFAIIITFFIIVIAFGLVPGRIYTNYYINILESLVFSNLIMLSSIAYVTSHIHLKVLVYYSLVFVIMVSIIVYHFYIYCVPESLRLKIISSKILGIIRKSKKLDNSTSVPAENAPPNVTTSVIELREPLLDN